jgi:hypothetical protein
MGKDSRLRAAAQGLGERAFNSISEDDVARVHAEVFPAPTPGTTRTAELTLCRLAMACRAMAAAVSMRPHALWAFLKVTQLQTLVDGGLATDLDRAQWDEFEARLLAAAFRED